MTTKAKMVATPWGGAAIVEEVRIKQTAGAKEFGSVIQLLAGERGERLVRFAYSTDGTNRRGPVTLRAKDLDRLRKLMAKTEGLGPALGWEAGA